jgi:hypothetical protein
MPGLRLLIGFTGKPLSDLEENALLARARQRCTSFVPYLAQGFLFARRAALFRAKKKAPGGAFF